MRQSLQEPKLNQTESEEYNRFKLAMKKIVSVPKDGIVAKLPPMFRERKPSSRKLKFEQFNEQAEFLREASGSTNIKATLLKALAVFKRFEIPHYVCDGFAVQEHGYPRFTADVDIIVPDVKFAREKLSLNGFKENPGSSMTVTDRETKVEIDVLPGGGKVGPGTVSFPVPTIVSEHPQILELHLLISLKLSSYLGSPIRRAQDYADAIKLIEANRPSRELPVDPSVQVLFHSLWDEVVG